MSPYFCERLIETASVRLKSLARCISRFCIFRGGIWKGDIMVADIEEWEKMDASELHARRLNAKEVLNAAKKWKFHIPNRRWNSQIFGRGRHLRTSPWSVQNEAKNKKLKKNQMNYIRQPNFKTTRRGMMRKRKKTSGRSQENSVSVITLYQESNCTCRKKNH